MCLCLVSLLDRFNGIDCFADINKVHSIDKIMREKSSLTNKELKDRYKDEFYRIQQLINNFDPCGLIGAGAPADEYDCLTNQLINMTISGTTVERLKNLIVSEMTEHFGVSVPVDEPYRSVFYQQLHEFALNVRTMNKWNL